MIIRRYAKLLHVLYLLSPAAEDLISTVQFLFGCCCEHVLHSIRPELSASSKISALGYT